MTLEFTNEPQKKMWGLMQRKSLPDDWGMLFVFSPPQPINLWSFNCYIDLAVAFLDPSGVIQEISILKSYPDKMDPKRPVNSLRDLRRYPLNDPILDFYRKNSLVSKRPAAAALETDANFYSKHDIQVGDVLLYEMNNSKALFMHPLEIAEHIEKGKNRVIIKLETPQPIAIRDSQVYQLKFYGQVDELPVKQKDDISYSLEPVHAIFVETE
jgi:uncharacterized membrane protein (UPF0127 family)